MAFSPQKSSQSLPDAHSVIERDGAISIALESDKKSAQKEGAAQIQAIQTVHALSMFGPILGHAMASSENEVEQAQWLLSILKQSHIFAHQVFKELELEESQSWALAVLEKVYIDSYAQTNKAPSFKLTTVALEGFKRNEIKNETFKNDSISLFENITLETRVRLAWFEALASISRSQQKFDFFRPNPEQDLVEIGEKIWAFAIESLDLLLDKNATSSDRAAVLESVIKQAGQSLESSWFIEGQRASIALQQKNKADISAWKKANPQGFPLTTIFSRFEQQTRRLLLLSRQAPSSSSKTKKTTH